MSKNLDSLGDDLSRMQDEGMRGINKDPRRGGGGRRGGEEKTGMAEGGRGQLFVIYPYIKSSLSAAERINKLPRKARRRSLFHSSPFRPTRSSFAVYYTAGEGKRSPLSLFLFLRVYAPFICLLKSAIAHNVSKTVSA